VYSHFRIFFLPRALIKFAICPFCCRESFWNCDYEVNELNYASVADGLSDLHYCFLFYGVNFDTEPAIVWCESKTSSTRSALGDQDKKKLTPSDPWLVYYNFVLNWWPIWWIEGVINWTFFSYLTSLVSTLDMYLSIFLQVLVKSW
jgi:hypothetical protein